MTPRPALAFVLLLPACMQVGTPEATTTVAAMSRPSTLHSFTIERAYTLTDPRELAFRDQIAAEARQLCGFGDFSLYSSRPVGSEEVREDFLYRLHDVQITCDR